MFAQSADGHRIAFESVGQGRPTVLLHGFTDSRHSWREAGYVEALERAGRSPILLDARGHGDSDKPHDPALYASRRRADDVVAVLDALGVAQADLIGFSMGGGIALATALHHPSRVRCVATVSAHCFAQDLSMLRALVADGVDGWIAHLDAKGFQLSAAAKQRLQRNDIEALRACVVFDRPDSSYLLAKLQLPLMVLGGSEDPEHGLIQRFAAQTGAPFKTLTGRNHFSSFLAVEEIVAVLTGFFGSADAAQRRSA